MNRPSGAELASRVRANRAGKSPPPPTDPIATPCPRHRTLTVTVPDSIASRINARASLMGVSPAALCRALLRHYADHPELYGCEVDAQHRPTLHSQGILFDQLVGD